MSTAFADLGVPSDIVSVLSKRGIFEPFPIQAITLPDALAGRDVCGKAPTGSGKTLAFGITVIERLGQGAARARQPRSLILTPTRELCAQVAAEITPIAATRNQRVAAVYGGVAYTGQIRALSRGVDILVACPGRLSDLIQNRHLSLGAIEVAVVDEADRMADMGFLPEVRAILDQVSTKRQTLLFSATLDGDIDVLRDRYQNSPVLHEVAPQGIGRAKHVFWNVDPPGRTSLAAAIAAKGSTIIFCRTKHGTDRLASQLVARGVRAVAIHGDRSQAQRERALAAFTRGNADVLVATDVAARGIHIDAVDCVVHLDPPEDSKAYIHRSGRTARAGASGVVISFVLPSTRKAIRDLQRDLGMPQKTTQVEIDILGNDREPVIDLQAIRDQRNARASSPTRIRAQGPRTQGEHRSNATSQSWEPRRKTSRAQARLRTKKVEHRRSQPRSDRAGGITTTTSRTRANDITTSRRRSRTASQASSRTRIAQRTRSS